MNCSCSFVRLREPLLLLSLLLPTYALAQQGPGGLGGFSGVENLNTTSITVQVRGADGAKLNSMAVVNVSNLIGQTVGSQTTFGSQTIFQIGAGGYVIEVEAFGYEKARVQTDLSSAQPHQFVVVKLKPDTSSGVNYVAAAGVILSPKAQKELARALRIFRRTNLMRLSSISRPLRS